MENWKAILEAELKKKAVDVVNEVTQFWTEGGFKLPEGYVSELKREIMLIRLKPTTKEG